MPKIDERLLLVDRYGALAVPGALWVAMVYLSRYWILVIVVFASARRSPETVSLLGQDFAWFMLALELPVLLLMAAAAHRKPDAGRLVRSLWAHGRLILIATALLHIAAAGVALSASNVWQRWPELYIGSCALLDLAVVVALARDRYFRQLFADFPDRRDGNAAAAS